MAFVGTIVSSIEPERECWHEAGHAIVARHFGMIVGGVGFQWREGEQHPCSWVGYNGLDDHSKATQFLAGKAAEILKLGDYDISACGSDLRSWKELKCEHGHEYYTEHAMNILRTHDKGFQHVYEKLMQERENPSRKPFVDSDQIMRHVLLSPEELEALMYPRG